MNWAEWIFVGFGVATTGTIVLVVSAEFLTWGIKSWGVLMTWTARMLTWTKAGRPHMDGLRAQREEARALAARYLRVLESGERKAYPSELPWKEAK